MITIGQCRAARGLLDWTQQDLAEACGLSKTAINNFEKGHSDIKIESLRAIRMAFESANIEFLPNDGLRKRGESVAVLKGSLALSDLLDDIYATLKDKGGEVLIANIGEDSLRQVTPKKLQEHMERLHRADIAERVICPEGSVSALATPMTCRWLPAAQVKSAMGFFLYGDKVAFELWDRNLIVIITSPEASRTERMRFEYLWQAAQPLTGQGAAQKEKGGLR